MAALTAIATLAVAGCGPFPGERDEVDTGTANEEFVFIRTSHARYFYLVDTWRGLCYFGDRGFPQLTPIACSELPEARDILGPAAAADSDAGDEAEAAAIPDDGLPAGDAMAEDLGAPPTEAESRAFAEAYVELACAARTDGGAGVDTAARQAILSRHNLEEARYLQVRTRLAQDRDLWLSISTAIQQRCP